MTNTDTTAVTTTARRGSKMTETTVTIAELAAELGVEPYVLREFDITITDPMTEADAAAIREAWVSYEVQE